MEKEELLKEPAFIARTAYEKLGEDFIAYIALHILDSAEMVGAPIDADDIFERTTIKLMNMSNDIDELEGWIRRYACSKKGLISILDATRIKDTATRIFRYCEISVE